jgi:hypothetical protein
MKKSLSRVSPSSRNPFRGRQKPQVHASNSPLSLEAAESPEKVVTRLRGILADMDQMQLPIGTTGTAFLDALELVDGIRMKVREKAKQLLLKQPDALPGWRASEGVPVRELSRDASKVLELLSGEDENLPIETFLSACTTTLNAVRKLLAKRNSDWSTEQVEFELNRILRPLITYRQGYAKLTRIKDQLELPFADQNDDR